MKETGQYTQAEVASLPSFLARFAAFFSFGVRAGFFFSSLLFLISLGMISAPKTARCVVDAREAWADCHRSAVGSHHRDAHYKYTVLRDSLSWASLTTIWLKA